ncbi:TPA: sigma 54-interacting transcriptional regulator [Enterococcus faecium]
MKIKMKEAVLGYIEEDLEKATFAAQEIATHFGIKRSVASHYLNQLFSERKLSKNDTVRPVLFQLAKNEATDYFSTFIGFDKSLKSTINKCKAAVMYPPNGLPLIIKGNSGVGKSYLAKLIYHYALDREVIKQKAKFVVVNCADYANNPELLSAVLFGYKKGAFTGAEKDTEGMLSSADGGYLFLDEVHNLSSENQEKLFLLMDSHKYRKLGESEKWESANVRLILATTENTNNALLTTFRRRIPAEITLPDYNNRSTSEKIQLLFGFLSAEATEIASKIFCPIPLFTHFLSKSFEGNIGEFKNEIKLLCAEGYIQNSKKEAIYLGNPSDSGFWIEPGISFDSNQFFYEALTTINLRGLFQNSDSIKEKMSQLDNEINQKCQNISGYDYFKDDEFQVLRTYVLDCISTTIMNAGKGAIEEIAEALSIFILFIDAVDEIDRSFLFSHLRKFSSQNEKYLLLAKKICTDIEIEGSKKDLLLRWTVFLVTKYYENLPETHCLIVMHGGQTATALASETNKLLGNYVYDGFNMPIDGKTEDVIALINNFCQNIDTSKGLIVLVDMGSLEQMYEKIESNVIGDLVILNNVSTGLAIECGMQVCQKKPVSYFHQMDFDPYKVKVQYYKGLSQKKNIIVSCLSGQGISEKVKEILSNYLAEQLEVLTFDLNALKKIADEKDQVIFKDTVFVLSSIDLCIEGVECLNLEEVINGNQTLEKLEDYLAADQCERCLNELIKLFTIEGASMKLRFLDSKKVFNDIEKVLYEYEKYYQIKIPSFLRINLFLHLSSMIERIMIGDGAVDANLMIEQETFAEFLQISQKIFSEIRMIYCIEIPKGEYELIFMIFEQTFFTI